MSGHSKWAQIKHKKGIADIKKGQVFSKLARIITVAAREKGTDPEMNPTLRSAIEKAQTMNMPKDNIERAIEKAGGAGSEGLKEMIIEAYGPGGAAILIKAITDNSNRTIQELKHVLARYDGRLAGEGSVQWLFELYGSITASSANIPGPELELMAIEAGAQDIKQQQGEIVVLTKPEELELVKRKLLEQKVTISTAELDFLPKNMLPGLEPTIREKLETLFEALDEQDDVQEIYSNIEL